nr:oligosaccharide flippase family protein [Halomonas sp.]
MLYAGRTSSVLVAFLFMPIYSRILGPEQFATAAVILSLQALLMLMDLGLATLLSREVAVASSACGSPFKLVRTVEISLSILYLLLVIVLVIVKFTAGVFDLSLSTILGIMIFFWSIVLHNQYYTAVLARQKYIMANTIQLAGITLRAIVTLAALNYYSGTLDVFIWSQVVVSVMHSFVLRLLCFNELKKVAGSYVSRVTYQDCLELIRTASPLFLAGSAGAAAMHLDKPIMSLFFEANIIGPYFLAVMFSSTPIAVCAAPLVQYFQPKIYKDIVSLDSSSYRNNLASFVFAILFFVFFPVGILYIFCSEIIAFWLSGDVTLIEQVTSYSKILLVGYLVAAAGYIPFVLVIAHRDFGFHARLSIASTILILLCVFVFSVFENVYLICVSYVGYFLFITTAFLFRAKLKLE